MKKLNTSPISGMQELLPEAQATFDNLKTKIAEVYHQHGFYNIETPTIDRCDILLAKAGGDTEKQIYKVVKTAETEDEADQALRFDHTVPLARYVVEHQNDLTFPFKVTQIGRNFRGERAQRGRFREFYQCDVDVIGRNNLPLYYDADVILTLLDAFISFELETPVLARLNNRKIVNGMLNAWGLKDKAGAVFDAIDHSEKVTPEETRFALAEAGIEEAKIGDLLDFMRIRGGREEAVGRLRDLGVEDEDFAKGVAELDEVMKLLEAAGRQNEIVADMRIVRGLDYYTGTVFEFNLPEYPKVGSVCGGGRYENLAGHFTENKYPGVGGSIGLTRLFYVLNENNLVKSQTRQMLDYAVIPITEAETEYAMKVVKDLRAEGKTAVVVAMGSNRNLGDKLKYAAKIARQGIVIGETEAKTGEYSVKELR